MNTVKYGTSPIEMKHIALKNLLEAQKNKINSLEGKKFTSNELVEFESAALYIRVAQHLYNELVYSESTDTEYDILWVMSNEDALNLAITRSVKWICNNLVVSNKPLADIVENEFNKVCSQMLRSCNIPFSVVDYDGIDIAVNPNVGSSREDIITYAKNNGFVIIKEMGCDIIRKAQ